MEDILYNKSYYCQFEKLRIHVCSILIECLYYFKSPFEISKSNSLQKHLITQRITPRA